MNEQELTHICDLLDELWPRLDVSSSRERTNVWGIALRHFDHDVAESCIRDFASESRKLPHPADITDRCRQEIIDNEKARGGTLTPPSSNRWDVQRRQWAKADPVYEKEYMELSDDAVELHVLKWEYDQQLDQAGHNHRGTIVRYWKWQECCYKQGRRDDIPNLSNGYWTQELQDQYAAERKYGIPEAIEHDPQSGKFVTVPTETREQIEEHSKQIYDEVNKLTDDEYMRHRDAEMRRVPGLRNFSGFPARGRIWTSIVWRRLQMELGPGDPPATEEEHVETSSEIPSPEDWG